MYQARIVLDTNTSGLLKAADSITSIWDYVRAFTGLTGEDYEFNADDIRQHLIDYAEQKHGTGQPTGITRMHSAVTALYERISPEWNTKIHEAGRVLWRIEPHLDPRKPRTLLIQSLTRPDVSYYHPDAECTITPMDSYWPHPDHEGFKPGEILHFRVVVAPQRTDMKTKKQNILTRRDDRITWLKDHFRSISGKRDQLKEPWAEVISIVREAPAYTNTPLHIGVKANGDMVRQSLWMYDGILVVRQPRYLAHSIVQGFATKAKAYGAGLLSVKRPRPETY